MSQKLHTTFSLLTFFPTQKISATIILRTCVPRINHILNVVEKNLRSIHLAHSSFFRRYRKLVLVLHETPEISAKHIFILYSVIHFLVTIVRRFLRSHNSLFHHLYGDRKKIELPFFFRCGRKSVIKFRKDGYYWNWLWVKIRRE